MAPTTKPVRCNGTPAALAPSEIINTFKVKILLNAASLSTTTAPMIVRFGALSISTAKITEARELPDTDSPTKAVPLDAKYVTLALSSKLDIPSSDVFLPEWSVKTLAKLPDPLLNDLSNETKHLSSPSENCQTASEQSGILPGDENTTLELRNVLETRTVVIFPTAESLRTPGDSSVPLLDDPESETAYLSSPIENLQIASDQSEILPIAANRAPRVQNTNHMAPVQLCATS